MLCGRLLLPLNRWTLDTAVSACCISGSRSADRGFAMQAVNKSFVENWIDAHVDDATYVLKKPVSPSSRASAGGSRRWHTRTGGQVLDLIITCNLQHIGTVQPAVSRREWAGLRPATRVALFFLFVWGFRPQVLLEEFGKWANASEEERNNYFGYTFDEANLWISNNSALKVSPALRPRLQPKPFASLTGGRCCRLPGNKTEFAIIPPAPYLGLLAIDNSTV